MTDEAGFSITGNTSQNDFSVYVYQYKSDFSPMGKVIEFYERMLKAEQEKVNLLQEVLRD